MIVKVSVVLSPDHVEPAARFELVGGRVVAEWYDGDFQRMLDDWPVSPSDGERFLDELRRRFARSSRVIVEQVG